MRIDGARILILGATSAIAQQAGRLLAARGCKLALAGRDSDHLGAVAADLRVRGASVSVHVLDLAAASGQAALLDEAAAAMGGMDGAILAYGVLGAHASAERDWEAAREILDTNFTSAAGWISHLAGRFEAAGAGSITVIGSVAGDRGRASNYFYGAAKGGLEILLGGVRHRLARRGVDVVLIKPGFVDTPMTAHLPKSPLFTEPAAVARVLVRAMERGASTVYAPWWWRVVLFAVRNLPEALFHRTRL